MKTKIYLIVAFLMCVLFGQGQIVHQVGNSDNSLYTAISNADTGDIIELTEEGYYRIDSLLTIDKELTIRAAESLSDRPILRSFYPNTSARYIFEIATGGHLTLNGLDLDGMSSSDQYSAENLVQVASGITGTYSFYADNCHFHNIDQGEKGSCFRAYGDSYADTVKFTNCVLHDIGKIGIRINTTENAVKFFEFSNSSIYNSFAEGIYVTGSDIVFRVDHCTFDNLGWGSQDMIRPRYVLDAEIKNSIFSNVPEPRHRAMLLYGSSTIDYCNFYNVGDVDVHSSQEFVWGDSIFYNVDPLYSNKTFGDFLVTESSLRTASDDGSMLGDVNWETNRPFIPDTLKVTSLGNALYDSIQSARSGDVIELSVSGEYKLDSILYINKEVIIRAADGLESKPVIQLANSEISTRYIFEIQTGGLLRLEGLDLDGMAGSDSNAKYLIRTASEIDGLYSLFVEDCYLRDVASGTSDGNFFRAYSKAYADTVLFTNCVLYNSGGEGIRVKDSENTVEYFELSHSTMYRTAEEGVYVQGDEVEFVIDHCTFYDLGYNGYKFIRPRDILAADIKNTIFSTRTSSSSTIEVYGGEVDYCNFYDVGSVTYNSEVTVGDNILDVDPQFVDPSNGDFTLQETSPLYYSCKGLDHMGDLRWAVLAPELDYSIRPVGLDRNALYDTLLVANDGDIIELISSGDYLLDSLIDIDKNITIRAAEGLTTKPVISFVNGDISTRHIFQIVTGGDLYLSGVELDGISSSSTPAKYLIRTDESIDGSYNLIVEDCILHDVDMGDDNGNFFRAYSDTYADTVIFNNCILYNSGREGIRIKDSDNTVGYFQLSNSTMYNTSTEGVYIQGGNVIARIDHCTFNNLGYNYEEHTRLRYVVDAEITNCIYSNAQAPYSRCILFYGSLLSNCNFYNVGSVSGSSDSYVSLWDDYDPAYKDAENGDFTLLETSSMYFKATDGEALGDLRWATNVPANPTYSVHFTVLTEAELTPVEGASVLFNDETLATDASGVATFNNISPSEASAYTVLTENYLDGVGAVAIVNDDVYETVMLVAGTYSVTFTVSGEDGSVIPGATVVFNNQIVSTDENGVVVFEDVSPMDNLVYLISASGFTTATGSVSVVDTDISQLITMNSEATSVADQLRDQLQVFPNPATDYLKLTLPLNFSGTVELLDVTGRLLEIKNISNEQNITLGTEGFPEGVYFLKVSNSMVSETKRIVISR